MTIVLFTPDEANLQTRYLEVLYTERAIMSFVRELNLLTSDNINQSYSKGLIRVMKDTCVINTDNVSKSLVQSQESLDIIQLRATELKQEMEDRGYDVDLSDSDLLKIDCMGEHTINQLKQINNSCQTDLLNWMKLKQSILCEIFKCPINDPDYVSVQSMILIM